VEKFFGKRVKFFQSCMGSAALHFCGFLPHSALVYKTTDSLALHGSHVHFPTFADTHFACHGGMVRRMSPVGRLHTEIVYLSSITVLDKEQLRLHVAQWCSG